MIPLEEPRQQTRFVAGAQAALAIVLILTSVRGGVTCTLFSGREKWAATKIQSVYRGHLARRALRALRGLVKFQALVKGFIVRKRVTTTLYSIQALLRAQLAIRYQRAHRSFKDHRVQPKIRPQKSTERFDNDTRSEIHSKRLSTSHDSIKISYDESPKIVGMDPYRPHGQSRRNHYQDLERGFTFKDNKCSKTTRSTPRIAYSNRSNTPTRPPKSVCRDAFSRPYLNRPDKKEDMGKVSKWFRGLLGMKKDKENMDNSNAKTKRRWCFGKSMKNPSQRVTVENDSTRMRSCMSASEKEQNNHAIAVAETAVAAADAAVAGAQATVLEEHLRCHQERGLEVEERVVHLRNVVRIMVWIQMNMKYFQMWKKCLWLMEFLMVHLVEKIIHETSKKIFKIRDRMHAPRDRQKSYADKRHRPLEFEVGDKVMLKVAPWKGVVRFGKRRKLNPYYIGPFLIIERIGLVAYRLELP
ncbi:IQ-DOMAIN 14-like protein [Tanacetum coccineum]